MNHDIVKPLYNAVSELFEVEESSLSDAFSESDCEAWDSLGHVSLVQELESVFHVSFSMDEIASLKSVGDIRRTLEKKCTEITL